MTPEQLDLFKQHWKEALDRMEKKDQLKEALKHYEEKAVPGMTDTVKIVMPTEKPDFGKDAADYYEKSLQKAFHEGYAKPAMPTHMLTMSEKELEAIKKNLVALKKDLESYATVGIDGKVDGQHAVGDAMTQKPLFESSKAAEAGQAYAGPGVGEVVVLKSGGPLMTVTCVENTPTGTVLQASWQDDVGNPRDAKFPAVCLDVVKPEEMAALLQDMGFDRIDALIREGQNLSLTPESISDTSPSSTQTPPGGKIMDAKLVRESLSNLRWVQDPSNKYLDQWILQGDSSVVPGPQTLVIAKKQEEGQWRISYSHTAFPGLPSHNVSTLNQGIRGALDAMGNLGVKQLPWTDGTIYEPNLAAAKTAIEQAASTPSEPDPTPAPSKVKRPSARAKAAQAAVSEAPATPMVEERVQVKMPGGYKTHFKYGKEHKMSTTETILESLAHGAKVGVADEAGEATLGIAEAIFGEHYPELAKTPRGRSIMKAVGAGGMMFLAGSQPEMLGGMAESVTAGCAMVLEAAGRDLLQPEMKKITPMIKQLAEAGASSLGKSIS